MRHSSQRDLVYKLLKESLHHPTAREVYLAAREVMPKISLGTVYRNLKDLCDAGKVRALKTGDGDELRYDAFLELHSHFVCRYCGKIYDICDAPTAPQEVDGHAVEEASVVYYGKCHDCSNNASKA